MLILLAGFVLACSTKKADEATNGKTASIEGESAAMDSFHMLMAETFHPFKDSGNLEPIKTHADELAAAADAWAAQPLPERLKNEDVKTKLQKLQTETHALADLVQSGNDEAIGTALVRLHELFHELHNRWSSKPGEDEEEHAR